MLSRTELLSPAKASLLGLFLGVVICGGCSGKSGELPRAQAQGTVTLDGNPLPKGMIRFIPQSPTTGPAASTAIVEGIFEFPRQGRPIVGTHRVEIDESRDPVPDPEDAAAVAKYLQAQKKKPRKGRLKSPPFHPKGELTAVVSEEGPNEFTFEVFSK